MEMGQNREVYSKSHRQAVKDTVSADLSIKFDSFITSSAALRAFERETGISKRQVERYISKKSLPQFLNLKRIYSFITGISDFESLLKSIPEVIALELKSKNTNAHLPSSIKQKSDFSREMESCRAFSFIYWNTVSGNELSKERVERKFGEYGTKVLSKMEKLDIIQRYDRHLFVCGTNRSTPIDMEAASSVGCDLIENHFKANNTVVEGNNFLGFQVFSLNKEAKRQALIKMEKLHRELMELAAKSSGDEEPFFTVVCGDSMNESNLNPVMGMEH